MSRVSESHSMGLKNTFLLTDTKESQLQSSRAKTQHKNPQLIKNKTACAPANHFYSFSLFYMGFLFLSGQSNNNNTNIKFFQDTKRQDYLNVFYANMCI